MMVHAYVVEGRVGTEDERLLCVKYGARIRAYGLRHLRDATAAQDLVQAVLLAVLQAVRAGRIEDPAKLDHYVFGTCRNAVMDMRRSDARQRKIAEQAVAALPEAYVSGGSGIDRMRLEHCIGGLEPRDRAIVLATFMDGRDAEEIGAEMKLTPGNVRVIRHRALARLQGCVEGRPS